MTSDCQHRSHGKPHILLTCDRKHPLELGHLSDGDQRVTLLGANQLASQIATVLDKFCGDSFSPLVLRKRGETVAM
jgi:hypothetical protein